MTQGCQTQLPNLGRLQAAPTAPQQAIAPGGDSSSSCSLKLETEKLCASIEWIHLPRARQADGEFVLSFSSSSATSNLQDPQNLPFVKLWMPMGKMGHGSDPVELHRESEGIYRARGVNFRMAGRWQIWVQLRDRATGKSPLDEVVEDVQIR